MSNIATISQTEIVNQSLARNVSDSGEVLLMLEKIIRDPKIDMDRVEKAFAMHSEMRAEEARRAFNLAIAAIQSELPQVKRDALNKHTQSKYARLETISAAVDPIITKYGVSLSYGTEASPLQGHYRVICDVTLGSHEKRYALDLPADATGAKGNSTKTAIHAAGSTFSYARRYLKLMIFDIALKNEDDDGNQGRPFGEADPRQQEISQYGHRQREPELKSAPVETKSSETHDNAAPEVLEEPTLSDEQIMAMREMLEGAGRSEQKFCKFINVSALSEIYSSRYDFFIETIRETIRKAGAANGR